MATLRDVDFSGHRLWRSISFHAEIVGAGGWPTFVGDFYAEFYYTFTGSFK